MRLKGLLHKMFLDASVMIDKRIHKTLLLAAETLSQFRHLSIAGIGRTLKTSAQVKHAIKRMDRLFGNKNLQDHIIYYYQNIAKWLLENNSRPIVVIDWSGLTHCGKFHFLRASIPVGGRALPILDIAYSIKEYTTPKAHRKFIRHLKKILPMDCQAIIVTDAGFRCPWFKLVKSQGWGFVGRVRHRTYYLRPGNKLWQSTKSLYSEASLRAKHLFDGKLTKDKKMNCGFYIIKQKKKYRERRNLSGKKIQCSASKKHEKREREPWLIVSSLSPDSYTPEQVINIYKKRMQVEESFRDLKNTKNGFSLRHCRSDQIGRLNIALLIGAIAMLILWILGFMAKKQQIHWSFQSNSIRSHNVLSLFIIGWQWLIRKKHRFDKKQFFQAMEGIALCAKNG